MKEFLAIMQNWGGIILLLILAVIGIICSLAGSSSAAERRLSGKDDEHYVLRLPLGRVVYPLILLAAGIVLEFLCKPLQKLLVPDMEWIVPVIQLVVALIFGLLFWSQLAKVLRKRVFVNGDNLIVTPAIGHSIETNYKQIRTVANKIAGRDRGVIGKKIRTKEGNRFEVINTMPGYDLFVSQLEEKVELPNLTKKLFKKHDKKAEPAPVPEDVVVNEPLPQASAAALEAAAEAVEEPAAEPAAEWVMPEPGTDAEIPAEPAVSEAETEEPAEPAEAGADAEITEGSEAADADAEIAEETAVTEADTEITEEPEVAEADAEISETAEVPEAEAEEAADLPAEEQGIPDASELPEDAEIPEDSIT